MFYITLSKLTNILFNIFVCNWITSTMCVALNSLLLTDYHWSSSILVVRACLCDLTIVMILIKCECVCIVTNSII